MDPSLPPSTMKAWQYTSTKPSLLKNLTLNPSAPLPKPKSNQHLVKIIATALNPVDYKPAEMIPGVARFAITTPATPCIDFAGTIVKPAPGSPLKPGQLVFGCSGNSPLAGGALAEYNVSRVDATVALPDNVDPIDAATVGVAALTAYQSIVPHVKKGDRVFINGGSGGTGVFGIQFAKVVGCHVTTTCSERNIELCKSLGADEVVDYRQGGVVEALKGSGSKFDHGVDNVGSDKEMLWRCHEFLKPGAEYVVVGGEPSIANLTDMLKRKVWPRFLGGLKGKVVGFWPQPKPEDLERIGEWMSESKVRAVIDERFGLEEAPRAFEKLKTGRARGKIVVDVASET
ncbi:hypothetical protein P7C71_g5114, partial [Lecanoromycetidae sp. Uapishka_2]